MVAAINLTPATDVVGATITITGTGFTPSEDITLTYGGAPLTPVAPISTDGSGDFSGTFIVPASVAGVHSVVATDETLLTDDMDFTVTPNLVITEANTTVGATINFTGTGFSGSEDISFTFDGDAATPVAPVSSNATGGFTGSFVVTAAPNGARTLVATDESTETDSDTVVVDAKISLNVASGDYGDSVTVTGTGFDAASATTITFNGVDVTGAALNTDADGGFSRAITVPDAPFGVNVIEAEDAGTNSDTDNFTVAALITLTPTSGGPGDTITIAGHGFAASEDITFTIEGNALTTDPASVSSDADGAFSADFDIPLTGYDGNAVTIVATDESTNTDSAELNVIISELAINTTFSRFNGRDLHHKSVNALGSIEKSAIVDVTFSASDVYQTGGMPVQFSDVGFNQVYLCKIIHQNIGRNMSFVVGASNNPDGGKIKIWGTDGNELADESTLVQSKSVRVQIRGI